VRLVRVVANVAADRGSARLLQPGATGAGRGGVAASWALLARRPEDFGELASDSRWTVASLLPEPAVGTWTDDFHNLLSVFKW
jgi:hypothetical protein